MTRARTGVRAWFAGVGLVALATGCWKDVYQEVPPDVFEFQPEAGGPPDWRVSPLQVPLTCPDGEDATFYALYPESASDGSPLPAAVLYHSGSFDYVYAAQPGDPLTGSHFADPSRLDSGWAVHQVFATLGMYPELDDVEIHDGRLPAALAEAGIAVLLPANCWGDLWADEPGAVDNDFASDLFARQGRAAAEWAYQFLADPTFAPLFGVELPFVADPAAVWAIGLGEGGRAVMEVASADRDGDGVPDHTIAGAAVDSPPDDLRIYFADPGLYASTVVGLSRIYPGGAEQTASGSVWSAPLPERFAYLYSAGDPAVVTGTNDAALARLAGTAAWVDGADGVGHVRLNGGAEPDLPARLVEFLNSGVVPD